MKTYLQTTDGEDTWRWWLVGTDELDIRRHTDAMAIRRQVRRDSIVRKGAGWTALQVHDQANKGIVLEATMARTWDTELEAWEWTHSLTRDDEDMPHPVEGDIYMRLELPGGGWRDEKIANALVQVTAVDAIGGVTVRVRYRITGPKTEPADTGTYAWLLTEDGQHLLTEDGRYLAAEDHET